MFDFMKSKVNQISAKEVKDYLDSGNKCAIIDVRSASEFKDGHIKNAINIPLDSLELITNEVPDKSTKIFVNCLSGMRSKTGATKFAAMGYEDVHSVTGGISGFAGDLVK